MGAFSRPCPTAAVGASRRDRLSILFTAVRKPCLALGPFVLAAARGTHHRGGHGWKLVHVGHFDPGGHGAALRRALDHDDRHDPSSIDGTNTAPTEHSAG